MPSWKKVVLHGSSGSLAHLKLENLTSQSVLGTDASGNVVAGSVSGYSLPVATNSTLGGIKVGSGLTMNGGTGVLSVNTSITASKAIVTADSASTQVYGLYFGAVNSNSTPKADATGLNYFPFTQTTTIKNLTVSNNITVNGTVDGRDIAADGTKLDGLIAQTSSFLTNTVTKIGTSTTNLASGDIIISGSGGVVTSFSNGRFIISSTAYSLPIATASTLGGVKIGSGITINRETGEISAAAGTTLSADRQTFYSGSLALLGSGATTVAYSAQVGGFIISSTDTDTNTWRPLGTGATDAAAGNHNHDSVYLKIADTGSIIDHIVASAPGTLDTLNELAAAIGDDSNFSASIAAKIASKADANHTHANYDKYENWIITDRTNAGVVTSGSVLTVQGSGATSVAFDRNSSTLTISSTDTDTNTWRPLGTGATDAAAGNHNHDGVYAAASHNHDGRYYTETEADSRFVNASGDTMTGGLYGSNALLGNWIADSMPESATFFDSRLVNDLAYARLRGKSVSSNYFSATSLDTILNGAGDFISLGQANIPEGGVVIEIESPRTLNYGCKYGIMFGNTSWMTDYVKLESYRNGAWQTDLEVSGNRSHILMTSVIGNNHLGASRFRFTIDRPVYTTSIRIANVFAFNYNSIGARELYVTRDGGSIYSNLSIDGNLSITGTVDGRDIASDGTKLDGIASNANNYSLPAATTSALGGIKIGTNLSIDANGVVSSTNTNTVTSVGISGDLSTGNITLAGSGATSITKSGGTITISSTDNNTTYSDFTGATAERDGTSGLVIAPRSANRAQYLRGDGTWATPPDTDTNTWRPLGTGATDAAAGNHNHDSTYAAVSHNHDSRYYTETESDTRFARNDSTSSGDLLGLVTLNVDLTLSTEWQATGIRGNALATGTYIIQVYANDYAVGGGHYTEYYSGTMSWYGTTTNSAGTDEIVLHRAGHAPNSGRIYLRTRRTAAASDGNFHLDMAGDTNNSGSSRYVFKFRRLI